MTSQDNRFVKFVADRLAEYADGEGGMAHDVLYLIEEKYREYYGELPEVEW